MWVIGSSFVWLPLLAFIFRGTLVGTLGWFTLILILYWVPAFVGSSGSGVRSPDERASMRIGTHHKI